jgi:hypothetical protein
MNEGDQIVKPWTGHFSQSGSCGIEFVLVAGFPPCSVGTQTGEDFVRYMEAQGRKLEL